MPQLARRSSDRKGTTLRKRPSMSPALTSFLSPSRLRLGQRLYSQSPPTQKSPVETNIRPSPPSPPAEDIPGTESPTMPKPRNGAIGAIANWLAVKSSASPIDRPTTDPIPALTAPEPIPAMLRYPAKDPNEITQSPHCIDCAYRHGHTHFEWIEAGDEATGRQSQELKVDVGTRPTLYRRASQDEKGNISRNESSRSISTLVSTSEEVSADRPFLATETKGKGSTSPLAILAGVNLIALPESHEVVFASPEVEASDGEDLGIPSPLSMSMQAATGDVAEESSPHPADHRVWLCSPPPRSSTLPDALEFPDPPVSLGTGHSIPIQMTRSKSEAAVSDTLHTPHHPPMPRMQPSSFSARYGKTMRRNRPLVVRSVSTGRLATEFDEQGRVVCLSAHSERVLGNKISTDPAMWKIKPVTINSLPQTPTSPSSRSLRGTLRGRPAFARAAQSVRGRRQMESVPAMPVPRRASSTLPDGAAAAAVPSEFGLMQQGLDGNTVSGEQGWSMGSAVNV